MLQLELSNIKDIYNSGETTITSAIKLLQSNHHGHTSITEGAYYPSLEMLSVGLLGQPLQKTYIALKQDKSAHCHTGITMQHPSAHCINTEYHKICHTG